MALIELKFDGACHNKVGESSVMGIGIAVFFDGEYMEEESKAIRIVPEKVRGTSNISEWEGCIEAWDMAIHLNNRYPGNEIKVYSDSQLITNQFNGKYAINQESFNAYRKVAVERRDSINPSLEIMWIPREENKEADKLSKLGLKVGLVSRSELQL